MNAEDIVRRFFTESPAYARNEVDAAVKDWGQVGPLLIARTLQRAKELRAGKTFGLEDKGLNYAVNLFGHQRDPAAWSALYAVCTLPDEVADENIGSSACEELGQILYRCCGGKHGRLVDLLHRQDTNQWVRIAALHALQYAGAEGKIERKALLEAMLAVVAADDGPVELVYLIQEAGDSLLDFHPHEYAGLISGLVARGMLQPKGGAARLAELLREDSAACEQTYKRHRSALARHEPADIHKRISWRDCFQPRKRPARSSQNRAMAPLAQPAVGQTQARIPHITAEEREVRKQKLKQAKKSKKANRKR